MSNPKINLFKLWENGKLLKEAIIEFNNKSEPTKFRGIVSKQISPLIKQDNIDGQNAVTAFDKMASTWRAKNEVEENFRHKLSNGQLVGLGYQIPRELSDKPVIVPKDIWLKAKLNYGASSLLGGGLEFASIKIIARIDLVKRNIIILNNGPVRKAGRPSRTEDIVEAYNNLLEEVPGIDFSASLKSNVKGIQEKIIALTGNKSLDGIGEETIRKTVGKQFQAKKYMLKHVNKL